jgi:nucleoside-diphosphate-sugar epimerase
MSITIAITGGTGFVGSHTIDAALAAGCTVRALARRPQPPRPGVTWLPMPGGSVGDLCSGAAVVIHIAGVTNARTAAQFAAGNAGLTATVVAAAAAAGCPVVQVSSLAARAPALSVYGAAKAAAEAVVMAGGTPWAMLRPPGVYGPRDTDMLALFRAARFGIVPAPDARASLIYATDLASALLVLAQDMAGPQHTAGQVWEIDDGHGGYRQADIARAAGLALGRRTRVLPVPGWGLAAAALVATAAASARGRLPVLSRDRARYLQHDWIADGAPFHAATGWVPTVYIGTGMAATAAWYRAQGLL